MTLAHHIADLKALSLYSELDDFIERCRSQIDRSPEGQIASILRDWLVDARAGLEPVIVNLAKLEQQARIEEQADATEVVRDMLERSVAGLSGSVKEA